MPFHLQRPLLRWLPICQHLQKRCVRSLIIGSTQSTGAFEQLLVSQTNKWNLCTQHLRNSNWGYSSMRLLSITHKNFRQNEMSEEDLSQLTSKTLERILESVPQKLKKNYIDQNDNIRQQIQYLLSERFKAEDVSHMFIGAPGLLNYSEETFIQQIRILRHHGFLPLNIPVLLHSYPEIMGVKESAIMETLDKLRSIGFRDGRLQIILSRHPVLFSTPLTSITERFKQLMTMFRKSDILLSVYRMPELLTCSWRSIEDKVVYVHDYMGLHQGHMLKSRLFSHSLLHVKSRHLFLARAGLYQTPDKHGVTQIDNPTLDQIIDTSDKEFAHKVARLPLEEFQAFLHIMEQQSEAEKHMIPVDEDDINEDSDEESNRNSYRKKYE